MNKYFFFAAFLAWSQSFAGVSTAGDGGHVVICDNGKDTQLLDFYEARTYYNFKPRFQRPIYASAYSLFPFDENATEIYKRAQLVLGKKHPLLKILANIQTTYRIATKKTKLVPTKDTGLIAGRLPNDCRITQAARRVFLRNKWQIEVERKISKRLSDVDLFGLILHETLHQWFASYTPNTTAVRQAAIYLSAPTKFRRKNAALFRELVETRKPVNYELIERK